MIRHGRHGSVKAVGPVASVSPKLGPGGNFGTLIVTNIVYHFSYMVQDDSNAK